MLDKVALIEKILTPSADSENIEIADVQYLKENGNWVVRVFIDKIDNGITLDDCEKMSYIFGDILDTSDVLDNSYVLEISSPGINRVLRKERDFKRFIGEKVKIRTFNAINNQKNFLGEIISFEDGKLILNDITKGEVEINFSDIKKANLEADI